MQIKATMRYHFTPTRTAITKKYKTTSIGEDVEKSEPSNIAGGNVNGTDTLEECGSFLKS